MGSQQQKLLWSVKGLPRDHRWFLKHVWRYPVTTQGKCRSGSSCNQRVILPSQGDRLPSWHLSSRACGPTCQHHYPHLGSGQQGSFPFSPECLHLHEVFKAEWTTQQGKWWCDWTCLSLLNYRTVSWSQMDLPFVHPRLFPKLLLKQNTFL